MLQTESSSLDRDAVAVGVVLVSYNEGDALTRAVERLTGTSGLDEVVVVDASNQRRSREIAVHLSDSVASKPTGPRITVISDAQAGRAAQMNRGASRISTEVVLFLHVDTELPDDAIGIIRARLDSTLAWGRFDVRLEDPHWAFRVIEFCMNLRSSVSGICTGDQSIFVTRQLFDRVGGYRPIAIMEDIDFSLRLKKVSRPIVIRKQVRTSARRWRQYGILRTIVLMWRLRFAFWLGASPDALAARYRASAPAGVTNPGYRD